MSNVNLLTNYQAYLNPNYVENNNNNNFNWLGSELGPQNAFNPNYSDGELSPSFLGRSFDNFLQKMLKNPPAWLKPYIHNANKEATVWGDPHFDEGGYMDGAHQKFEFQGKPGKTYNLLSDTGLQFDGTFQKYSKTANTIAKTSLTLTNDMNGDKSVITFNKDGQAEVNGHTLKNGQTVQLADGGTATMKNGELIVKTGAGYTITEKADHGYVDADVKTGALGMDNPDGLLAAVLTDNAAEERDIENNPQKYEKEFEVNA